MCAHGYSQISNNQLTADITLLTVGFVCCQDRFVSRLTNLPLTPQKQERCQTVLCIYTVSHTSETCERMLVFLFQIIDTNCHQLPTALTRAVPLTSKV